MKSGIIKKCRVIVFLVLSLCSSIPLFSQVSCDPSSTFYDLAQAWKLRGIVDSLPPLRPYPLENIKQILLTVIERGNPTDIRSAKFFLETVTGKPWYMSFESDLTFRSGSEDGWGTGLVELYPDISGDVALLNNRLSIGYHMGLTLRNAVDTDFQSAYTNSLHDSILNSARLGKMDAYLDVNDAVSFGSQRFFLQTGIYRTGYGLYLDEGLALNDTSYHKSNFSFSYLGNRWSYSQQHSVLGATLGYNGNHTSQAFIFPDKFLAFHQVSFEPLPSLQFSLYECMVYGKRFDPSYVFPIPYIVAQELNGFKDNGIIGATAVVNPYKGFAWATDVFVDKISFNDIFNWNFTSSNRFAVKTGFIYTPENSFCARVQTNYTLITPYTYSHEDDSGIINYQNYSNNGICMGSSYPPNSDCITFKITFLPLPNFQIEIDSFFMRHANASESMSTEDALTCLTSDSLTYATDGSIFTLPVSESTFTLLNQESVMYIFHTGIHTRYSLPRFIWGNLSFTFGYTFEYIKNKGVDSTIYPNRVVTKNSDGTYTYAGTTYDASETDILVQTFKDAWKGTFKDVLNNYITVGLSYSF